MVVMQPADQQASRRGQSAGNRLDQQSQTLPSSSSSLFPEDSCRGNRERSKGIVDESAESAFRHLNLEKDGWTVEQGKRSGLAADKHSNMDSYNVFLRVGQEIEQRDP